MVTYVFSLMIDAVMPVETYSVLSGISMLHVLFVQSNTAVCTIDGI
jgi:hypothetical protein